MALPTRHVGVGTRKLPTGEPMIKCSLIEGRDVVLWAKVLSMTRVAGLTFRDTSVIASIFSQSTCDVLVAIKAFGDGRTLKWSVTLAAILLTSEVSMAR